MKKWRGNLTGAGRSTGIANGSKAANDVRSNGGLDLALRSNEQRNGGQRIQNYRNCFPFLNPLHDQVLHNIKSLKN